MVILRSSEYFRRLALADLERRQRWANLFDAGAKVGEQMGVTSEVQVYSLVADYKHEKQQKA